MNLAQYLNRFYQDIGESNTNRFPVDLMKEWLDECERRVNNYSKCVFKTTDIALVNDQAEYTLPADILDMKVKSVYVYVNGTRADNLYMLTKTSIPQLDLYNGFWRSTKGTPRYWYINNETGKIGLFPYPANTTEAADGICITYSGKHTKMTRYYTTGTIAIANAGTAVTGTSTAFTGNVIAGDEIGVGKLLDPTYTTGFPATFYTIATVHGNTSATISSAFAEATVTGVSYIASSVSSIVYPDLNKAVLLFAKSLAKIKDKDPNMAMYFEAEADRVMKLETERIQNMEIDDLDLVPSGMLQPPGYTGKDYGH